MKDHDETEREKELEDLRAAVAEARQVGKFKPAEGVFARLEAKYAAMVR